MPLNVTEFTGDLTGLARRLVRANSALNGGQALGSDVELIGPFPLFTLAITEILETGLERASPGIWRALIQSAGIPVAAVDIDYQGEIPSYNIRGTDAAALFANALSKAMEFQSAPERFDVRLLTIPSVYSSALWLSGEPSKLIPIQLGGQDFPEATAFSEEEFLSILRSLREETLRAEERLDQTDEQELPPRPIERF